MLKLFKTRNPYSLLLIPILTGAAVYFRLRIPNKLPPDLSAAYLPDVLLPSLSPDNHFWLQFLLAVVLLNALIFLGSFLVNSGNLMLQNNFLYPFVLTFILLMTPELPEMIRSLFSALLIILAILFLLQAAENESSPFSYFNAGLLIAVAALFNPVYLFFLLLIPAALWVFRHPKANEFFAGLLGLITPYWILYGLHFFFTGSYIIQPSPFDWIQNYTLIVPEIYTYEIPQSAYLVILLLFSTFFSAGMRSKLNIIHRLNFNFLFLSFFICMLALIVFPSERYRLFPVIAFLSSIPISFYLNNSKARLVPKISFSLFLLLIVLSYINYYTHIFF